MLKLPRGNWNPQHTNPPFEFRLNFKLPKPLKERIIFSRDKLGRIVSSKSPIVAELLSDLDRPEVNATMFKLNRLSDAGVLK